MNARLPKIYPNTSDSCSRCKRSLANHTHMFWSCLNLTDFWHQFFDSLGVFDMELSPEPLAALFGVSPLTIPNFPATKRCVLAFTSLLARRLIGMETCSPPSHNSWLKEVLVHIKLEKLWCMHIATYCPMVGGIVHAPLPTSLLLMYTPPHANVCTIRLPVIENT